MSALPNRGGATPTPTAAAAAAAAGEAGTAGVPGLAAAFPRRAVGGGGGGVGGPSVGEAGTGPTASTSSQESPAADTVGPPFRLATAATGDAATAKTAAGGTGTVHGRAKSAASRADAAADDDEAGAGAGAGEPGAVGIATLKSAGRPSFSRDNSAGASRARQSSEPAKAASKAHKGTHVRPGEQNCGPPHTLAQGRKLAAVGHRGCRSKVAGGSHFSGVLCAR